MPAPRKRVWKRTGRKVYRHGGKAMYVGTAYRGRTTKPKSRLGIKNFV